MAHSPTDLRIGCTSSALKAEEEAVELGTSVSAQDVAVFRVTGGSPLTAGALPLQGSASGRCLDVANASTAAGATVPTWDCHTADHQLWTSSAGGEIRVFGDKNLDARN